MIYLFDNFRLSENDFHLSRDGARVPLEPKAMRVLLLLVSNSGKLMEKKLLLETVWKDTFVEETTLTRAIALLRKQLGDDSRSPRYIETVPTLGYRFIARVEALREGPDLPQEPPASPILPEKLPPSPTLRPIATTSTGSRGRNRVYITAASTIILIGSVTLLALHARQRRLQLNARDTVVLTDFANKSGDPVFDGTLRQGLVVQLEQSPVLRLTSDGQIRKTLKMMGLTPETALTSEISLEICQRIGGDVVLDGSVARLGAEYVIGLRARSCRTGDELDTEQAEVKQKEDVLEALSQLATRFRTRIGESRSSIQEKNTPLAEATTPSLEALKSFSQAIRLFNTSGSKAAIPLFVHATSLDPEFAIAHAWLGRMYADLGQSALAAQSTKQAYSLRQKASERERFLIDVSYDLLVTGNLAHARETCEAWEQMYPRDVFARSFLSAVILPAYGQYEQALHEANESVAIDSEFVVGYKNQIANLIALNRIPEAEKALSEAARRKLYLPSFVTDSYRIAYLKNDQQGMQRALSAAPTNPWIANYQATSLLRSGRLALAATTFDHAIALSRQSSRRDIEAQLQTSRAISEAWYARYDDSLQRTRDALELDKSRNVVYGAALVAGLAGDAATAEERIDYLVQHFHDDTIVQENFVPTVRAALALAHNQPAAAVELLHPTRNYELGQPLHSIYLRGAAYLAMKNPTAAAAELQKIVAHPGLSVADPLYSISQLQLARAYAMIGDREKARTTYQSTIRSWAGADRAFRVGAQAQSEYSSF